VTVVVLGGRIARPIEVTVTLIVMALPRGPRVLIVPAEPLFYGLAIEIGRGIVVTKAPLQRAMKLCVGKVTAGCIKGVIQTRGFVSGARGIHSKESVVEDGTIIGMEAIEKFRVALVVSKLLRHIEGVAKLEEAAVIQSEVVSI
jgi:hypothetical protein